MSDANQARVQDSLAAGLPAVASRLVDTVVDGDVDPAVAFTARICTRRLGVGTARETILHPPAWTRVAEWCAMVPAPPDATLPAGWRRYLEVVNTDCDGGGLGYRVWLDFSPVDEWGGRHVLTYRMSPAAVQRDLVVDGHRADRSLAIDEGSLVVRLDDRRSGDGKDDVRLRVITTKRLRHASEAVGRAALKLAETDFYEQGERFITTVTGGEAQVEECADVDTDQ